MCKVPRRWCKSHQTYMCQMCSCWCHKRRGQKILSFIFRFVSVTKHPLRKHTVTLQTCCTYTYSVTYYLVNKNTVLISVTIFSLILVSQYTLHMLLLKQTVAIFWVPPLDSLDTYLSADPQNSLMKTKSIIMSMDFVKRSQ